ncbi:MAG: hypothetical protein R6V32_11110 [Bacteroidales bacterium]
METQPILCYVDFTDVTDNLKLWTGFLHKKTGRAIDLLFVKDHNTRIVFNKNITDSEINQKLNQFRDESGAHTGKNYIREGCNCSLIYEIAEARDAIFTLVPVHKYKDVQFLSSTVLMKMLRNSRIPCLIIPENNTFHIPSHICFLANSRKTQKIVSPWLVHLSKYMDLQVQLTMPQTNETSIKQNYSFMHSFCGDHDIDTEKLTSEKSVVKTEKNIVKSNKNNIYISHLGPAPSLFDRILGDRDAKIAANKYGTPVFCINSRDDLFVPCT